MSNYDYLIEKINSQSVSKDPFDFVYCEDFFSGEHFAQIVNATQVNVPEFASTEAMCEQLQQIYNYSPVSFPGCTQDVDSYISWYNERNDDYKTANKDLLEGVGIAFRLQSYSDTILQELVDFFNSDAWHACIKNKFGKTAETRVETAIQKYVSGYEISPHPDIRRKCATYMININHPRAEHLELHTHFMKFTKDKQHLYEYWENNLDVDRCWVPWSWADTTFKHTKNNSITMFAPNSRTMHAVKLDYDHLQFQRTQFYGNLWYTGSEKLPKATWRDLTTV
jgi:hypothetical protein